jgi:hypothetical protein
MKIQVLKAHAYELAGVTNTQELKANYDRIRRLNLRRKAAWQEAVEFLKTQPIPNHAGAKTIHELKAAVYKLAQVSGTKQLKANYASLGQLNFSFKSAWETALDLLQDNLSDFEAWRESPPEEYRELFADIESTSHALGESIGKAKALGKDAKEMAASLEKLGQEAKAEAEHLREDADTHLRVARQAEFN